MKVRLFFQKKRILRELTPIKKHFFFYATAVRTQHVKTIPACHLKHKNELHRDSIPSQYLNTETIVG